MTIGLSLTVFSKLSLVSSTVATKSLSRINLAVSAVYSRHHVRRPVRPVADRAAALRITGRRACQLHGGEERKRQVAAAYGRPRQGAGAARRGGWDLAYA